MVALWPRQWWLAIIDLVGWTLVVVSGFKTRRLVYTTPFLLMASAGVRSLAIVRAATRVRVRKIYQISNDSARWDSDRQQTGMGVMSRGGGGRWMDAHGRGVGGAAAAAASLPGLNAAGVTIIQMNAKKR